VKTIEAVTWLALAAASHAAEPARQSIRQEIASVLKESYAYDEAKREESASTGNATDTDEVVTLPSVVVTTRRDDAAVAIAAARQKTEHEKFDLQNGGTFLKKRGEHVTTELKLQFSPEKGGFELLKFAW